jgi:hypothetical protein
MENMEEKMLNSEKIWKIWKKGKLNSEMIWKIWNKSKLNSEKIWKIWKKAKWNILFFSIFRMGTKYGKMKCFITSCTRKVG